MDPNEKNNNVIQFYGAKQENGYLSNFYPSPFQVGDYVYKTNEHYFQSKKFEGHEEEKLVIEAEKPGQAFKLGRNSKFPKRKEWQEVKDEVMY